MSPASADEALEMLTAAMGYLAAADATAMTAEEQARCLRVLERANSAGTAARTSVLSGFTSGRGYCADADYSPRAWLIHKTGVTRGAAVAYTAWVRRAEDHPRDKHCQWAGRCDQPAGACQVHHTRHKANGGPTSVKDCLLLCWFHHQVVIHRWGWTLVLNPDGTTSAWNKDKTTALHSHGPPVRPG
jgi:hypothetical protein